MSSFLEYNGMKLVKKIYTKLPVLLFDVLAIIIAWNSSFLFQYGTGGVYDKVANTHSIMALCYLLTIQIVCYYFFKVYRGLWHFASLHDVACILRAVITACIIAYPVFYFNGFVKHFSNFILPVYSLTLIALLCAGRLFLRESWDKRKKSHEIAKKIKNVLIIGAGQAGESLIRDLRRTGMYLSVGILDDNPRKQGLEIHGVRVLGKVSQINSLVKEYEIDLIFIAIPTARSKEMRQIVNHCEKTKIPFRTLPGLDALANGSVQVNALREVNIEDLLGRDQIELNWDKIALAIKGKRILVTGGGGSIGSELCRQIMRLCPEKLLILDNSEFNLYKIDHELKGKYSDSEIILSLVSVVDSNAVTHVFEKFKPEIVFHAASFKHVPMLEEQVREAVLNNAIGTKIIAEASVAVKTEIFVYISTDKAVNPTNIMGTTKRIAEIYCQNLNSRVDTHFITVRFGNVLGSVGSVVPLFKKQLQNGGPLTVTHPEIERYFMTIAEACQLILQGMVIGKGGEIFVLDMGQPIKIKYLAEQMICLAGKKPGQDIKIKYTGLRPGEKLFEELFHSCEQLQKTEHAKLFKARFREMHWDEMMEAMRMLQSACLSFQHDELIVLLNNLVPEFNYKKVVEHENTILLNDVSIEKI